MIEVLHSGVLSSIQDLGRYHYRHFGVPLSGVMDQYSSSYANIVIQNNSDSAVLEITMIGPKLRFKKPTVICISGAVIQPQINNKAISMYTPINIKVNDILSFGKLEFGLRAYIAVKGGFKSEYILGSYAMYAGITKQHQLKAGDIIEYNTFESNASVKTAKIKYNQAVISENTLEAYPAPEFSHLDTQQKHLLLNSEFKISKYYDRMAYRLEGFPKNNLPSILTSGVMPGTVQLTPSGELIVLMRDAQTTGGYPRILQLSNQSMNILSQKKMNEAVKFKYLK